MRRCFNRFDNCFLCVAAVVLALAATGCVSARAGVVSPASDTALADKLPVAPGALADKLPVAPSDIQGGLVVHLGCGDGKRTVQLRANDGFIVQGLDTSAENVQKARQHITQCGLYGTVTAREFDGRNLPFADGTVNLLVVDNPFSVSQQELLRVLCPKGKLCTKQGGQWKVETKPWPAELDEWTHYQHDPQGTMVGKDRVVGPPRHIQWVGDPKWLRNHDFMCSMHAMVSSGGRIFYIIDEGLRNHVFLPAQWTLIARDAFNGTILWKRPLKDWHPANWPLKSGPGYLPRRLVAVGGRVFVTLGLLEPATVIDAATGRAIRTYEGTKTTEEIAFADGILYLLVDPNKQPVGYKAETAAYSEINRANTGWGWSKESPERSIVAVEADSGKILWKHAAKIAPLTPTVGKSEVFFFDGDSMVALDRQTGKQQWVSDSPGLRIKPATGAAPRVILSDGVLVLCYATQVFGISAKNGKLLWDGKIPPTGHHSPSDLFVINGLVWSAHTGAQQEKGTHFIALDLRTGATAKDFVAENLPGFPMHPRCYTCRATERYIMTAGMGTEFYEVGGNKVEIHNYVRGSCIYGMMPCNGLLYKPPDSCACYYLSKLEDLCALAPASPTTAAKKPISEDARLEKGPAYALTPGPQSLIPNPQSPIPNPQSLIPNPSDWPMYRHDAARSGSSTAPVAAELKKSWEVKLGGRLTQPVIASGKVYVAAVDVHTVYALDPGTGKVLWKYTVGGRIDSAPTIYQGLVLFGSADGWVYCLRADDGALAWRYLVAPDDRQIVSYQQLESVWPVSGSVLVYGNAVYALAGRNMFFDGGMRLVRLEPATGRKISETVLDEIDPQTGKNLQTLITAKRMPVANPDLLSCDGRYVYMATQRFDLEGKRTEIAPLPAKSNEYAYVAPERFDRQGKRIESPPLPIMVNNPEEQGRHLFCPTGFLDSTWYHRTYWIYGAICGEGWADYNLAQKQTPCGRIMALDGSRAYGFRADNLGNNLLPTPMYRLYAADLRIKEPGAARQDDAAPPRQAKDPAPPQQGKKKAGQRIKKADQAKEENIAGGYKVYWQVPNPPLLVNAMALGGKSLLIAGPPDVADETKMLGFLPGADDEINRELKAQDATWRGKQGALLWVVSAEDGKRLAEYRLDAVPVWDGMSVAGGKLFISLQNGTLMCWDKN